jgi:fatty acid desaturase
MNLREILSESEFSEVTRKSDALAWSLIAFDWLVIVGLFVVVANYPNPITVLLAVILLGGRQLGLGVVVHETGHRTLFRTPALNDFCGKWLAGYWVFSDKDAYMRGHLKHHQDAGTEDDPDLPNYVDYPVSRERLRRKITRDLTGQIGWRRMKSIGRSIARMNSLKPQIKQTVVRSLALNMAMLAVLALFSQAWLYLLWVIAFMTSHMLVTRIRQIAEHGAVPDHLSEDARLNTRTLYISPLERLLIAPHQVNYHLEHHLMASVPIYRLRRLHDLLKSKGYYEDVDFTTGYLNLLRQVTYSASQGS